MDYSLQHHESYIGRPASQLPTPALVVSLPVVKRNIEALHRDVEKLGIGFRPHVKTLKSLEVTRMMLAGGKYKGIITSTLAEIRGVLPLVEEGILEECVYSMPVYPGVLPRLVELRQKLRIILLVDNEQHISILNDSAVAEPWDIFIKLDVGTSRAGVRPESPQLTRLLEAANQSSSVSIYGFYCHAGHSYGGRSRDQAEKTLQTEIDSVLGAAKLLPAHQELVLSVGSTPTAHVVESLKASVPQNVKLELHAGNFPCNDLQQVSTAVISEKDQAVRIATEVCSVYPERNEALVNAGAIALSRETSGFPGFGKVVDQPAWTVVRLSQEHGILGTTGKGSASEDFKIGQRVWIYCNHVCITAAAFHVYYVVDEDDVVRQTWVPWKGW